MYDDGKKIFASLFLFPTLLFTLLLSQTLTSHALTLESIMCLFYDHSSEPLASEGKERDLIRKLIAQNKNTVKKAQIAIKDNKPQIVNTTLVPLLHSIKTSLHKQFDISLNLKNAKPQYLISKLNNQQCQALFLQEEALAEFNVGLQFHHGNKKPKDKPTALAWFSKSAEKNFPLSHYWVGLYHFKGIATPQNYKKARLHFLKADPHNIPEASYSLGVIYQKGLGTTPDIFKARYHYQKAAENNLTHAQALLAQIYTHDPQHSNLVKAYKWWTIAEKNGYKDAYHHKKHILSLMSSLQKWEAERRTRVWLQQNKSNPKISSAKSPSP